VAVDLYARTAGATPRAEGFEYEPHVRALQPAAINDDVAAAVGYLRSPEGGAAARLYSVGFCLGGRISLLQAAAGLNLDGVIGCYPWPVGPHRSGLPAPADEAPRFACRVLALYGGADQGIPAEAREAFDAALTAAGVEHQSIVYPDAPHSFFDRKAAEFTDASADAWRQMLDFVGVAA
jgi:carboxymethylenebutenolidase